MLVLSEYEFKCEKTPSRFQKSLEIQSVLHAETNMTYCQALSIPEIVYLYKNLISLI